MPHKPTSKVERRFMATEFRVSDPDQPVKISGYGAVFNSPTDNGYWIESVDPHAFDAVLAKSDCRALWNHNPDYVLGRQSSGTLALTIDARGLAYEIDPPATTIASDLVVSMRRKDVRESSFAFITARDQWTENRDGTVSRVILEIEELLDVSPVTYPAYSSATATVRSRPDTLPASMPREIRSRIERRADGDGDPDANGCECDCSSCQDGDCSACTDTDCTDPNCTGCPAQDEERSRSAADTERRRMEMRLALARLGR